MALSNYERQKKWLSNPKNLAKRRKEAREAYHKKKKEREVHLLIYGCLPPVVKRPRSKGRRRRVKD